MMPAHNDEWTTEDDRYSEEKFWTHSTDGRGHSEHIRFGMPPTMVAKINELVQSKQFPDIRSTQDFVRDAVYHRLHFLAKWKGNAQLKQVVEFEMRMVEREQAIKWLDRQHESITLTEDLFRKAVDRQDRMALIDAIQKAEQDVAALMEPYRTRLVELLDMYRGKLKDNKELQ